MSNNNRWTDARSTREPQEPLESFTCSSCRGTGVYHFAARRPEDQIPDTTCAVCFGAKVLYRARTIVEAREPQEVSPEIQALWDLEEKHPPMVGNRYQGARLPQAGWQPIAAAPKDGTKVLLADQRTSRVAQGRYIPQGAVGPVGHWYTFDAPLNFQPTHWMPLPTAPGTPQEDKA